MRPPMTSPSLPRPILAPGGGAGLVGLALGEPGATTLGREGRIDGNKPIVAEWRVALLSAGEFALLNAAHHGVVLKSVLFRVSVGCDHLNLLFHRNSIGAD